MPTRKAQIILKIVKQLYPITERMDIKMQRFTQDGLGLMRNPASRVTFFIGEREQFRMAWIRKKRAEKTPYVILYFHGGGYITGTLKLARRMASKVCCKYRLDVLAVEYRLAPENPFPCALEDALSAFQYLKEQGYREEQILLMGESAGGGLLLSLCLKLKQMGSRMPCALVCMSPWTDLTMSGPSYTENIENNATFSPNAIRRAARMYAGEHNKEDPLVSPRFGDFKSFPPTLIQAGSEELLLSDSVLLAEGMERDGVDVRLEIYDGMCHVFQLYPFLEAREALDGIGAFFKERIREQEKNSQWSR